MRRIALALVVTCAVAPALARADDTPPGKIVLAKATGDAVALYDASSEVAGIVRDGSSDDAANRRLERDALAVLAKELPELSNARTATIRVTYTRTGDVSPAYGSPTFVGIERYANLKCSLADARADRSPWSTAPTEKLPGWATFDIVGKLPPR